MLSLVQLSEQIAALRQGRLSLDDFEDWFSDNSVGAHASDDPRIVEAIASIESALSEYHFENATEAAISQELQRSVLRLQRPQVRAEASAEPVEVSYGDAQFIISTASSTPVTALPDHQDFLQDDPFLVSGSVVAAG